MNLHSRRKQIIVSSDRPLDKVRDMGQGLTSFFGKGRVIEIGFPDLETRVAILRRKAQEDSVELPEEVVHLVARLHDNIRMLEGSILRVNAASSRKGVR